MASKPKQRIVTEAAQLHSSKGLDAVSMRAIAARIGVSATSIYRHFQDKDALIEALIENGFAALAVYLQRRPKNARRPASLIVAGNFLDFAFDEPRLYQLMFLRPRHGGLLENVEAPRPPCFDVLVAAVAEDMTKGFLRRDDPLDVALTIWSHAHGLISMFTLGRFGRDVTLFRAFYKRAFHRMFAGLAAGKGTK